MHIFNIIYLLSIFILSVKCDTCEVVQDVTVVGSMVIEGALTTTLDITSTLCGSSYCAIKNTTFNTEAIVTNGTFCFQSECTALSNVEDLLVDPNRFSASMNVTYVRTLGVGTTTSSTAVTLIWNSEKIDTNNAFDLSTGGFTVTSDFTGDYAFDVAVPTHTVVAPDTSYTLVCGLANSGSTPVFTLNIASVTAFPNAQSATLSFSGIISIFANDIITVRCYAFSNLGSALTSFSIDGGTFAAHRISILT